MNPVSDVGSSGNGSTGSGSGAGAGVAFKALEFGRTHVVRPKGRHLATIVWLHELGDNGLSWSQQLETVPLHNVKWICPSAPTQPVAMLGGFPFSAWFDVEDISEDAAVDMEGLDAAAAHIAYLLSAEPPDIKLGIVGFGMGAAATLYSAICHVLGRFGNGNLYPINLSAVVSLSGWLPCSRTLRSWMEGSQEAEPRAASLPQEAEPRAASLPILLCHGLDDDVVAYEHGEKSSQALTSLGFRNLTFKHYDGLGHYTIPEEMEEMCNWLTTMLELEPTPSEP